MSISRYIVLLTALFLFSAGPVQAQQTADNIRAKIIGGVEAQPGAWPFMAALVTRGGDLFYDQFCGGTLIHPRWVVTAAHCVVSQFASDIDVVLGVHDLVDDVNIAEWIHVEQIIVHPDYNDVTIDSDIALLKLAADSSSWPTWIITDDSSYVGQLATVIGWGNTDPNVSSFPTELRQVDIPIVTQNECQLAYWPDIITDNMLCAGYTQGGKDSCQGDSGGPLVVNEGGEWKLIGIVSWAEGCALAGYPGVNTRVSQFVQFIKSYVPEPDQIVPPPFDQRGPYGLWNGYLGMINVLELVNNSQDTEQVSVYLYRLNGSVASLYTTSLAPYTQEDVILNSLRGFSRDSYGIITIVGSVDGRIFYYLPEGQTFDSFEFAFGTQLADPTYGPSYVAFNTFQPSANPADWNNLVANWLSVVNLADSQKGFTINKYDQQGTLLSSGRVNVGASGRVDLDGGHISPGPYNVGLLEVVPDRNDTPYMAQLMRYGYGFGGAFDFAFPLVATAGMGGPIDVPLSSTLGAQNWLEVANTGSASAPVTVTFYSQEGNVLATRSETLASYSQQHFNAAEILGANAIGHATVRAGQGSSVVAESMFYYPSWSGTIVSMYGSQARESSASQVVGSFNLFLNMENYLKLINTSGSTANIDVTISSLFSPGSSRTVTLAPYASTDLALHDTQNFGTAPNTYGAVIVAPQGGATALSEIVRLRYSPSSGELEYVAPTNVQ